LEALLERVEVALGHQAIPVGFPTALEIRLSLVHVSSGRAKTVIDVEQFPGRWIGGHFEERIARYDPVADFDIAPTDDARDFGLDLKLLARVDASDGKGLLGDVVALGFDQREVGAGIVFLVDVAVHNRGCSAEDDDGQQKLEDFAHENAFHCGLRERGRSVRNIFQDQVNSGEIQIFGGLWEDGEFRTNLGLCEVWGEELRGTVAVLDAEMDELGSERFELRAYENIQINRVAAGIGGATNLENGLIRVTVINGDSRIGAYISIVDNSSGDLTSCPDGRKPTLSHKTRVGDIVIELDPDAAPDAMGKKLNLAEGPAFSPASAHNSLYANQPGYYDGFIFDRALFERSHDPSPCSKN